MTTATCRVAEEQLAVEIQDAQNIPEKVHRFFFHHRCAEAACEWRHNELAAPQQKGKGCRKRHLGQELVLVL